MKRSELIFSALLVPLDYLMIFCAGVLAYQLRFGQFVQGLRPVFYAMDLRQYLVIVAGVGGIFLLTFAVSGLYAVRGTRGLFDEIGKIFIGCSAAMTVIIITVFFQREIFSSRFIVVSGWVLSFVLVTLGRSFIRWIQRLLLRRGIGVRNVVVIGTDAFTEELAKQLHKNTSLGFRVVLRSDTFSDSFREELLPKIQSHQIDELIVGYGTMPSADMLSVKEFADEHHLAFRYVAGLLGFQTTHIKLDTIVDIPIVEVLRTRLDGWGKIWKRGFDMVISSVLAIILSPLLFSIAVLIKIDSAGPVIEKLDRVGEKGKTFKLRKFRSMIKNAHALKKELLQYNERRDGPLFKIKDDPRVTRVGRMIRKLSLDELPQLWNVLRGDMSLVGPRPHEPEEVARYEKWQKRLLTIKPGMTGMAQISGRSDLHFDDEARLDVYYIENWSVGLDVRILLRTPWVVLSARSVS